MNLQFEKAAEEDAAQLIEVLNQSFYDDYISFGECPGYDVPMEDMKDRIRNSYQYKILVNQNIIGNISICKQDDGRYWLGCLAVIPEFQSRGIGSKAIGFIEKEFPDATSWGLDTPVQKAGNCRFYEKMGYMGVEDRVYSEKVTLRTYEKMMK